MASIRRWLQEAALVFHVEQTAKVTPAGVDTAVTHFDDVHEIFPVELALIAVENNRAQGWLRHRTTELDLVGVVLSEVAAGAQILHSVAGAGVGFERLVTRFESACPRPAICAMRWVA